MPSSQAGTRFLELLAVDENAFDKLYCVTFQLMDAQWLVKRASYMEFNVPCTSRFTNLSCFFLGVILVDLFGWFPLPYKFLHIFTGSSKIHKNPTRAGACS
jgi:ELMO/CED-12 family